MGFIEALRGVAVLCGLGIAAVAVAGSPVIQQIEDHVVFPDGLICPGGLVEQSIDFHAVLQCLPVSGALGFRVNWDTTLTNTADGTSVWVRGGYSETLTGIEYENDTCPQDLWSAAPLATDYTRSGAIIRASIPGLGLAWSDIGHFSIDLVTYEYFAAGNFTEFDLCEYFELTECTETTPFVPGCDGGCYPDWWMGDGWCDEPLNCAERDYDGGDCL